MSYRQHHLQALEQLQQTKEAIYLGGGKKALEKLKKKGKWSARERIAYLIDKDSPFYEIAPLAAYGMYESEGGAPSAGVVVGIGKVAKRWCVVVANDATVKAGAWFPMTGKKNLRAQEIALQNHLPIIYLVDSAGVYLPMQDEIFPDKYHFGRIFYNNAILSSKGIPQIAAIMGPCVAGGAYLPIMSDEALIVDGTGYVFLAGPYLVRSAIGEIVDEETLGGATTHSEISGVTDYKVPDDKTALDTIKQIVEKLGPFPKANFERSTPTPPEYDPDTILDILPDNPIKPYDSHELLKCIVDKGSFVEYKAGYGKTLITGYARIEGWAVGIVMNQRKLVKTRQGEIQYGGVIYSDSADKAARFIMNCNQKRIPIIFFQDVTGFMVGKRSEHGGIIKDGAKMVNVVANTTVPKITFIIGNSYGAGNYAMCGRAYEPRFLWAWHTARIGVMGGAQAAKTLLQIQKAKYKKQGKELSKEEEEKLLKTIMQRYEEQTTPYYAAARLWVDDIIDPRKTREYIAMSLEVANHNPHIPRFNPGVIQT